MELYADNVRIPLNEAISLKLYNPLFNDIGGISFPVNFNARIPSVQKAFGFPSRREAEVKARTEGRIKAPFLNLVGAWQVNRASDSTIEAYFKTSTGDFYSQIKDRYLHEVDYGGLKDLPDDFLDANASVMDTYYPESEFAAFCAYVPNMPCNYPDVDSIVNFVSLDDNGDPFFNPTPLSTGHSVYLFAGTILEYIFMEAGYKVESNIFISDPDLCRLVVFNTFNILAPIYSDEFVNNNLKVDYAKLVPHITCGDFLKALRNRFNVGFFIDEQSRSVNIKSFNQIIAAGPSNSFIKCGISPVENNRLAGIRFPFVAADTYATHGILSEDELNNVIEVNKYRDILPATRDEGDLFFVKSERNYYRISAELAAVKLCSDDIQYTEGNASEEITQTSAIPAMYTFTTTLQYTYLVEGEPTNGETAVDFLVPRCDLTGNRAESEFTTFPLMFMFARGIVNNYTVPADGAPTYKYPLGTSDLFDPSGNDVTGTMTLKWGGTYGLIEKLWLNRVAWELGIKKLVKTSILPEDINKIVFFDRVIRIGNDNYLVNLIGLTITEKDVRVNELELLRL